jgi:hypothetical protein
MYCLSSEPWLQHASFLKYDLSSTATATFHSFLFVTSKQADKEEKKNRNASIQKKIIMKLWNFLF